MGFIDPPVSCSQEEWSTYIQVNPDAAVLRYKELEHTDELEIIFRGTVGSGEADVPEPPAPHRRHNNDTSIIYLSDAKPKDVKPERNEPICEFVESRPQDEQPERASVSLMQWSQ